MKKVYLFGIAAMLLAFSVLSVSVSAHSDDYNMMNSFDSSGDAYYGMNNAGQMYGLAMYGVTYPYHAEMMDAMYEGLSSPLLHIGSDNYTEENIMNGYVANLGCEM